MAIGGLATVSSQLFLLQPLMNCVQEKGVIIVSLLGSVISTSGIVLTAFYPEKWVLYAGLLPGCIGHLAFAAISSIKSSNCSEKVHGWHDAIEPVQPT